MWCQVINDDSNIYVQGPQAVKKRRGGKPETANKKWYHALFTIPTRPTKTRIDPNPLSFYTSGYVAPLNKFLHAAPMLLASFFNDAFHALPVAKYFGGKNTYTNTRGTGKPPREQNTRPYVSTSYLYTHGYNHTL